MPYLLESFIIQFVSIVHGAPLDNPTGLVMVSTETIKTIIRIGLSLIAAVLLAVTFRILTAAGGRLTGTSKYPFRPLQRNINVILNLTWPENSTASTSDDMKPLSQVPDTLRLLYVGRFAGETGQRIARGITDCRAYPQKQLPSNQFWLTNGSLLTKHVLQLAVWVHVLSGIIVIFIVVGVLQLWETYKGQVSWWISVFQVMALSILWRAFMLRQINHFLANVTVGAAWSFLHRANFAVVDTSEFDVRLSRVSENPLIEFKEIDKTNINFVQTPFDARLAHEMESSKTKPRLSAAELEFKSEDAKAISGVNLVQQVEREIATAAARMALNFVVLAAVFLTVAILITAFPTSQSACGQEYCGGWTAAAVFVMLLSAMMTSAWKTNELNTSFETMLFLREIKINNLSTSYVKKQAERKRPVSFTMGAAQVYQDILSAATHFESFRDILGFVALGPAYFLLPSSADQLRKSRSSEFEISVHIRNRHTVIFTTGPTDKQDADDASEAIHVCYIPMGIYHQEEKA
jgi:hypothetical protein